MFGEDEKSQIGEGADRRRRPAAPGKHYLAGRILQLSEPASFPRKAAGALGEIGAEAIDSFGDGSTSKAPCRR
jgi:hypothetical protein